ncbi:MAG TPA: thioredoxin domain-containing protein [Thermoanaerobaculia bacterium]|nr:thioredoxin domain-containing protein [Thermoanaerobaculia bacterium]
MNFDLESLRSRLALAAPVVLAALMLVALPACAQSGEAAGNDGEMMAEDDNSVVATIDGEDITMDELEAESEEALDQVEMQLKQCEMQAKSNRYSALNASLQNLVRDRMIAAEAEKAGQSVEDYRATELESRIGEVTDAEVEAFFNENQARIGDRTIEQIGEQIRQYLTTQKRTEAEEAFYGALEAKYDVAMLLEPPRVEVAAEGPSAGPEDAAVTIVEFSDFQCPFCSRVNPTLDQVKATYGENVRVVFRQFPLNIHPQAQKAAEASLCADDQGKFWEMHDAMFANQQQLAVENLKAQAAEIGLDAEQFNECLDSDKYADKVAEDMQDGIAAGVSGTPAMFINGVMVSGAVPYEQVAEVIDAELKRKGIDNAGGGDSAE